jgi:MFS transporter, SHS family, sialic acid transporter
MGVFDKPQLPGAQKSIAERGKWLALTAALLGWLFDGFEMGLFPVVSGPALKELLGLQGVEATKDAVSFWNSVITSSFLIGAATGGVLFGWLGDRLGRVRAMSVSILTYALCSGVGGFATAPWQMVVIRFFAALGMGGEWSLGVALVMEVWKGRSRALLAGLIGAAANFGYMLVALLSLGLGSFRAGLASLNLPENWVEWRLLMVCGALPAVLTFFIRLFVPESESWEKEKLRGATSSWATRDLLWVLGGVGICVLLLIVWRQVEGLAPRLAVTAIALVLVAGCYLAPIIGYLSRSAEEPVQRRAILRTMVLGAFLSGVPLLATWGAVQWAPLWAHQLHLNAVKDAEKKTKAEPAATAEAEIKRVEESTRNWKESTQMVTAFGAILASFGGALLAGWAGRRFTYVFLCLASLASVLLFYRGNTTFGLPFLLTAFLAGGFSAAFYGWLPLYLPELFPTRIRATGQGFCFNFGRILAAIGVLQVPVLMGEPPDYARACSLLAFIYVAGLVVIWFAPETKGKPLPE